MNESIQNKKIFLNGKDCTSDVLKYKISKNKVIIFFNENPKPYLYDSKNVRFIEITQEEKNAENLLNYFREIAEKMSHIYDFDTFFKEASPVEFDLTYNRSHDPQDIVKGYIDAVGRGKRKLPPPESAFSGIVQKPVISVSSRIITVMRKLWHGKRIKYCELFDAVGQRSELVATFLAVLELVKGKRVRVDGEGDEAQVYMLEDKK